MKTVTITVRLTEAEVQMLDQILEKQNELARRIGTRQQTKSEIIRNLIGTKWYNVVGKYQE